MQRANTMDSLFITGLASAYPSHSLKQEDFEDLLTRVYPDCIADPGLQKLVHFNRKTNIKSRPTIFDFSTWTKQDAKPPSLNEQSSIYRDIGVALSAQACSKAMLEAHVSASDITHLVAVTCTDQSNPGYDLYVCQKLGLRASVERILLHGVGCAGGLSALRTAANLATAASSRGQAARILVVACELCSLSFRAEIQTCLSDGELHIAPALFSDAAAAVVLCNILALTQSSNPIFQLQEWGSMFVPGTSGQMSYAIEANGMIANITKDVPKTAISAILPMLNTLLNTSNNPTHLNPLNFDWALHPGGSAILNGAKQHLQLADEHIRASLNIYGAYGNSSSPTVLIVLDQLRCMGRGRDDVVATSFGPGVAIEMVLMKRCRGVEIRSPVSVVVSGKRHKFWMELQSWITGVGKKNVVGKGLGRWSAVVR
ncbi:thiolase-like protein [Plenodomus tracheiphilus IPT5]|uniref:Thiolase-like protein n=1 Tax=Plenodomus tracheiphilus IPT5 TaxID=1408161 RepID=A0A6A7B7G1_9PLEO|nr:thiolase-like protein [Plenodomus tracheiphilus IPT5]